MIRFIDEQDRDQPFLLYVAFTAPHDPRTPPEAWRYDPATISLPPNAMPVHPFDTGDMDNRDENLETWPREPEAIRQHIADYYGIHPNYGNIEDFQHFLDEVHRFTTTQQDALLPAVENR